MFSSVGEVTQTFMEICLPAFFSVKVFGFPCNFIQEKISLEIRRSKVVCENDINIDSDYGQLPFD